MAAPITKGDLIRPLCEAEGSNGVPDGPSFFVYPVYLLHILELTLVF